MERGFLLYFIAEVKETDLGKQWLDNESNLTNDWLLRKKQEALAKLEEQEVTLSPHSNSINSNTLLMELLAI
jgi:hypothetical protein